jgi:hypothetical protein
MKVYRPNGSLVLEVVQIRYRGADFFWADVRWHTPTKKLFYEEKWIKIPWKATKRWYRVVE